MQHGPARTAQLPRRLGQRHEALGDFGNEATTDIVGQADPPRRSRRDLFGGQESVRQPAPDCCRGDFELIRGLLDRDHIGVRVGQRRGRDTGPLAPGPHARLGERETGTGTSALAVEDRRDLPVGLVLGEATDQLDGVLAELVAPGSAGVQLDAQLGPCVALPGNLDIGAALLGVTGDDDLGDQSAQEFLAIASGDGARRPQPRQLSGQLRQPLTLLLCEWRRAGCSKVASLPRSH